VLQRNTYALAPLAASSLWGGMYVVAKWGLGIIPPVLLSFLRVALASVVLLAVVRLTKPERSFSRADRRRFLLLGAVITLTLTTQLVGTELTNASQSSLLTVLTPVFTLALGVVVLDESLARAKTAGMGLAIAGTTLVLAGQYDLTNMAAGNAAGVVALLVASFAWAAYTVWGRDLVRTYSALETATYATVASTPMILVLVPVEFAVRDVSLGPSAVTGLLVLAVLYLGVFSTAAAWYLWYKGLESVDSGTVAVFFFAQPVVGSALGAVVLDEQLGPLFFLGGALMAAGVYVVSVNTEV
jgi:drug/metabolite transporter (DMT)-like permease